MKRIPRNIEKEHNGPDGHRIPDNFGKIAKNLGKRVMGQELNFEGPTGKLIYGGRKTNPVSGAFPEGTKVKIIGGDKPDFTKDGYIMDDDFIVIEDND